MVEMNLMTNKIIEELIIKLIPNGEIYIPNLKPKLLSQNGISVSFVAGTVFKGDDTILFPSYLNLKYV